MKRTRVCSHISRDGKGCPNLQPCPDHPPRAKNAHWSGDRDREAQRRFRAAVLARDGYRCTRCPSTTDLIAHHVRPGYELAAGITLCRSCHRAVDTHAR